MSVEQKPPITLEEEFALKEKALKENYGICMLKGSWKFTILGVLVGLPLGIKLKQQLLPLVGGVGGTFADYFASRNACEGHQEALRRFYDKRHELEMTGKLRPRGGMSPATPAPTQEVPEGQPSSDFSRDNTTDEFASSEPSIDFPEENPPVDELKDKWSTER